MVNYVGRIPESDPLTTAPSLHHKTVSKMFKCFKATLQKRVLCLNQRWSVFYFMQDCRSIIGLRSVFRCLVFKLSSSSFFAFSGSFVVGTSAVDRQAPRLHANYTHLPLHYSLLICQRVNFNCAFFLCWSVSPCQSRIRTRMLCPGGKCPKASAATITWRNPSTGCAV